MKESAENYLETIYKLEKQSGKVRSVDVAKAVGVSKPSVSRAMGKLKDLGMIEMDESSRIHLTTAGRKKAKTILEKEETISKFLVMTTDVEEETAKEDACKMGHYISDATFAGIKNFMKEVEEYKDEN